MSEKSNGSQVGLKDVIIPGLICLTASLIEIGFIISAISRMSRNEYNEGEMLGIFGLFGIAVISLIIQNQNLKKYKENQRN